MTYRLIPFHPAEKWRVSDGEGVVANVYNESDARRFAASADVLEALEAIVEEYSGISDQWMIKAQAAIARSKFDPKSDVTHHE